MNAAPAMLSVLGVHAPRLPRDPMPEPAWYKAFREMPIREFGMTIAEQNEASAAVPLRSVLPEDFRPA